MRVLVVGAAGREDALAWRLSRSPRVERVFATPGNPGIARWAEIAPVRPDSGDGFAGLADWAEAERIDLTVVGPEGPLVAGLADVFARRGLPVLGPTAAAARLEGSKAFAKEVMTRAGVPTAAYAVFDSFPEAREYLRRSATPLVVKADGLAAGKGVTVPETLAEAEAALHRLMIERAFGEAGRRVVLEERLAGREASLLALCDGVRALPLLPARDHKRLLPGDRGPNTGGMGAFAPVPDFPADQAARLVESIFEPVLAEMARRGTPYRGVLYAGLMLTEQGPRVLEFNCRMGDPEAQAILPLLESDFAELAYEAATGNLAGARATWRPGAAACVVLAARGYPGQPETGHPIEGCEEAESLPGVQLFHAGTARRDGQLVTAGGRVLNVVATGTTLAEAVEGAYRGVSRIRFAGATWRPDIGRAPATGA